MTTISIHKLKNLAAIKLRSRDEVDRAEGHRLELAIKVIEKERQEMETYLNSIWPNNSHRICMSMSEQNSEGMI